LKYPKEITDGKPNYRQKINYLGGQGCNYMNLIAIGNLIMELIMEVINESR
jgi:hypothetical protein